MKRFLSLVLAVTVSLSSVVPCWAQNPGATRSASATASDCEARAVRESREQTGTGGAFTIGLVSGLSLGLVGTAIAWAAQGEPAPPAASVDALENAECRLLYRDAYRKTGKAQKRRSAMFGGLVGTGIIVAIVASSASSD